MFEDGSTLVRSRQSVNFSAEPGLRQDCLWSPRPWVALLDPAGLSACLCPIRVRVDWRPGRCQARRWAGGSERGAQAVAGRPTCPTTPTTWLASQSWCQWGLVSHELLAGASCFGQRAGNNLRAAPGTPEVGSHRSYYSETHRPALVGALVLRRPCHSSSPVWAKAALAVGCGGPRYPASSLPSPGETRCGTGAR